MVCMLREWRPEDASALAALLNNKKIQDNLRDGIPFPYTKLDAAVFIGQMLERDPHALYAFAVTADGALAGSISVARQRNIHSHTGELGYYSGEAFWGAGVGTEAVRQMCGYIFAHTDIIRIFAEPFSYNTASRRVLEKNGFRLEGTMRQNACKNGRLQDRELYALLKEERCAGDIPG